MSLIQPRITTQPIRTTAILVFREKDCSKAIVLSSPGGEVVLKKGTDLKLKLKTALNTTS